MSRLPPKSSTIKKLFALSGNCCAFPKCQEQIINDHGSIVGEICHIEAAEKGGERYNPNQTDEERRSFENLILLCANHHKETNNVNAFSPETLKEMKSSHERKNIHHPQSVTEEQIGKALEKYMEQHNVNSENATQFNNQADNQTIVSQIGTQNNYYGEEQIDINKGQFRAVNDELKKVIDELRQDASPPTEDVIDYKNDLLDKRKSKIYNIPISELRFRKENGRIKAEVESYEKAVGRIDEISKEGQELLKEFLSKSDPEKKEILKQQIKHKGQLQPAIITCDGFLINGNRRKMIFEELYKETHSDSKFESMRVVILPTNVAVFDIKRIENRYQLQDEGKSEYHGLNRALTLRDNIKDNYSLEAQILEDPQYADKTGREFTSAVNDFKKKYLYPLECVDRYLETFNRTGLYNTISVSAGDKEGRWQAFIDYSAFYQSTLNNAAKRREFGIADEEVGQIENAIFKIIRKRNLNSKELERALGKVHSFVRGGNLKKYLQNSSAKKHLLNIAKKVDEDIPENEKIDENKVKFSEREIDEKWGNKNKDQILGSLMQAYKAVHNQDERDKPLDLLEDSLKKLNHENLKIENMGIEHYQKALELCRKISDKADEIYSCVDHARGELQKLKNKG